MREEFTPDFWKVVAISTDKDTPYRYKVLCYWKDNWRLNSGIIGIVETDDEYRLTSGSENIYHLKKGNEKITEHMPAHLESFLYDATIVGIYVKMEFIDMKDAKIENWCRE